MPITQVTKDQNRQLQNIANILAASQKVVIITGAGISTNCGIPVSLAGASGAGHANKHRISDLRTAYTLLSKPTTLTHPRPLIDKTEFKSSQARPISAIRGMVKPVLCPPTSKARTFSMPGSGRTQPAPPSSTNSSRRCVKEFEKRSSKPHQHIDS